MNDLHDNRIKRIKYQKNKIRSKNNENRYIRNEIMNVVDCWIVFEQTEEWCVELVCAKWSS